MNAKFSDFVGAWLTAQILAVVAICVFGGQGCTDAEWDSYRQYGSRAEMKCYSGPTLISHTVSTGKVLNETNSDGYRARWEILYIDNEKSEWKYAKAGDVISGGLSGSCVKFYFDVKGDAK
jgi:hypothetical protein